MATKLRIPGAVYVILTVHVLFWPIVFYAATVWIFGVDSGPVAVMFLICGCWAIRNYLTTRRQLRKAVNAATRRRRRPRR